MRKFVLPTKELLLRTLQLQHTMHIVPAFQNRTPDTLSCTRLEKISQLAQRIQAR